MQSASYYKLFKSLSRTLAVTLAMWTFCSQAGQFTYTFPVSSTGNNFTMLSAPATPGGTDVAMIGGTNDVVLNWDGTLNDAVAGAVENATISSDQAFFAEIWDAHDVMMYGPGTYTIYDGCPAGDPGCMIGNAVTFTVGADQIGAHMLFDWPVGSPPGPNADIDVVIVWNVNLSWNNQNSGFPFWDGEDNGSSCTGPSADPTNCVIDGLANTGSTVFNLISADVDGDGIPGHPMTDGAFQGSNANFNFNGITFPAFPPASSGGNNFTMLSAPATPGGTDVAMIGGTNDVVLNWNGTLNESVAGAVENATISSDQAFFAEIWDAHDVMLYGPGTYTVFDDCPAGDPGCGVGNAVDFTVASNQVGAHMLFDWPVGSPPGPNTDIDVVLVWNFNSTWTTQNPGFPFWDGEDNGSSCTGPSADPTNCVIDGAPNNDATVFDFISTDVDGDGIPGHPMTDGAFQGSNANFNLNGITFPNFPPVASDFGRSTLVNTAVVIDLTTYATDSDGTLEPTSVAIVPGSGPTNGVVVNNGDGTVTYTPNQGFVSPPTDSFQYTINDDFGETSNPATVTITVTAVANAAPVANDTPVTTSEDASLDISVDSVASDPDGDSLTFENFDTTTAEGGTVTVDATRTTLTYTPAAGWSGTDTFSYWVTDALDSSNIATITVTVSPALVCTDVTLNTDTDTPLTISIIDDLLSSCSDDPEGDNITLASFSQPTEPGSTVTDNGDGTLTYTPAAGFNGQDSFTYTATDGTETDTRTVNVDVGKAFGNFTMLDSTGVTFGGTNDVVFTWEGTCYTSVEEAQADVDGNMTMGSDLPQPFFGFTWTADPIWVYCPGGPYTIDTCNPGVTPPDCGDLTFSVPEGHLGGHMLFDWNVTEDIDVAIVWNNSTGGTWQNAASGGGLYQGPAGPTPAPDEFYDWISVDADGDDIPGIQFVDGPFIDFRANFNYKTQIGGGGEVEIPQSSVPSPNLGSATSGCTIGKAPRSILSGADWLVLAGFVSWLGVAVTRRRHRRLHGAS